MNHNDNFSKRVFALSTSSAISPSPRILDTLRREARSPFLSALFAWSICISIFKSSVRAALVEGKSL